MLWHKFSLFHQAFPLPFLYSSRVSLLMIWLQMPWFGSIFFLHVAHCWAGASKARTTEYWVLSTDSRFHLSSTGFWVQHQRLEKRLVNWLRCCSVLMNCTVCFASTRLHAKEQWQTVGWMWRAHLWLWTLRLYECLFDVCFEKSGP
jgi:hypothetical protein